MPEPAAHLTARDYLRAAKEAVRQTRVLISQSSPECAEQSGQLLREAEVHLGCAAAILQRDAAPPDAAIRASVAELQNEVAVLARFLSEADKLLSGWLRAVQSRRAGYTQRGQAAPLVLVSKLTVEG